MIPYLTKRLLFALVAIWAIATITFFMAFLAPGDPALLKYGEHSNPQAVQAFRHAHGLDLAPIPRYLRYVTAVAHGDLGTSFQNGQPVAQYIGQRFPTTMLLATISILIALLVGTAIGITASLRPNTWIDRVLMGFVLAGVSIPNFVIAPMLILLLSVKLGWLPIVWDGANPESMVLPAVVLAARPTALIARMVRSSMLDTLHQDYIRTARAKGLSPARILFVHALKNAFLPALTTTGTSFGYLLSGSFVVETVFAVPGVGQASFASFTERDYPMIQGVTVLLASIFVVVNLLIDLLYAALDPRSRQMDMNSPRGASA